jgi:hypothetical protein
MIEGYEDEAVSGARSASDNENRGGANFNLLTHSTHYTLFFSWKSLHSFHTFIFSFQPTFAHLVAAEDNYRRSLEVHCVKRELIYERMPVSAASRKAIAMVGIGL